ncbi:phosphoribosyltransferase [Amycolatopsis sp. NPDC021455]|uniref:phosphoribosyltransferase n=1 Tax=Amycolatopsis sp. NPDC021455 TaxID=3154901 RepID=UPI0033F9743E
MRFADRSDAGRRLARRLGPFRSEDVVVAGLPRGGVPVAFAVAQALHAPLDVIVVRKLGLPRQPEFALGAIGEDDVRVLDEDLVDRTGVTAAQLAAVDDRERVELNRRVTRYRTGRNRISLRGRSVIVVDDGIATGATARAACRVARAQGASRVVLAVPVCAPSAITSLAADVDEVVCLQAPRGFRSVGQWYRDFRPTSDDQVADLLQRAAAEVPAPADGDITLPLSRASLPGILTVPADATGIVVFAHGSGSSRRSPRNRHVAAVLNRAGLATLLFDLLTGPEADDRARIFDIPLLAGRLVEVTHWLGTRPDTAELPVGYFGASTGAAAALLAAADPSVDVRAIVSRGGRPDLAGPALPRVQSPTLLIVGGADADVLDLSRRARTAMRGETRLAVVPGAGHLFEEPGALDEVTALTRRWFVTHLAAAARRTATGPRTRTPRTGGVP